MTAAGPRAVLVGGPRDGDTIGPLPHPLPKTLKQIYPGAINPATIQYMGDGSPPPPLDMTPVPTIHYELITERGRPTFDREGNYRYRFRRIEGLP